MFSLLRSSARSAKIRAWLATMPHCIATSITIVPSVSPASPSAPPRAPTARIAAETMVAIMVTRFTGSDPRRSTWRPAIGVQNMVAALTSAISPTACAPRPYVGPVTRSAIAVQTAEKAAKIGAW